jgi:D-psicose/D-tagatose/L-ribulose 3-epimerase
MRKLQYAAHVLAWTTSWSNDTLHLIDHAKELGFDYIEIPLLELEKVDPPKIRERLDRVGLGVCVSTACSEETDVSADEAEIRKRGVEYLKQCVHAAHEIGANCFSGVLYSAMGGKLDGMPDERYWDRATTALKEIAKLAADMGILIGIEPINRYESFLINTCDQALKLLGMIDEPNMRIHLDAYHMNIEENNFYEPTKKAAPYLCHYHLSESHRGTPGTGTVNWDEIYRALGEANYTGVVGLESFIDVSDAMRAATCVWRPMASSSDALLTEGVKYLKRLEEKYYKT